MPFLADWTILAMLNDDGSWRCLGGRSADPQHRPLFAQLLSLPPQPLDPECRVAITARTRSPMVIPTPERGLALTLLGDGPHVGYLASLACGSAILAPLVVDDKVIGVLTLASVTAERFGAPDFAVLDDLIRRFRVAIAQVRLYPRGARGQPSQGRVPGDALARAAHAAERDSRLGAHAARPPAR